MSSEEVAVPEHKDYNDATERRSHMDTEVIEGGDPLPLLEVLEPSTPWVPDGEQEGAVGVEVTYRYHIFLPRGETYAFRFAGSEVTGVYGPLDYREVLFSTLPSLPYEDQI